MVCKTRKLAKTLFPREKWAKMESHIWVAASRLVEKVKEPDKWTKEMVQARILTSRGSVAFFLPEQEIKGETGRRCADLILDGIITEMKTVNGRIKTLGWEFKKGFKQGKALVERHTDIKEHSVFIQIQSDLKIEAVKAKIAGELKERTGKGSFICLFENSGDIFYWSYDELRALIGKR
jgi:hypothetical protein